MIYFIKAESGEIKIGFTTISGRKRLLELQTGSPTKLNLIFECDGTRRLEKQLHTYLKDHQIHGEWFRSGPLIDELIERVECGKRPLPYPKPGPKPSVKPRRGPLGPKKDSLTQRIYSLLKSNKGKLFTYESIAESLGVSLEVVHKGKFWIAGSHFPALRNKEGMWWRP